MKESVNLRSCEAFRFEERGFLGCGCVTNGIVLKEL